jgi:Zn-dependent metalloprotease
MYTHFNKIANKFSTKGHNCHICFIVPPHMHEQIIRNSDDQKLIESTLSHLQSSERARGKREIAGVMQTAFMGGTSDLQRTVFNCNKIEDLQFGQIARREGEPKKGDAAVDEAYDYSGNTYQFYNEVFERNSIDGKGMPLNSYVHYGSGYNNAYWDGQEMVYGDGDGKIFDRFTKIIDVVGHELTHGVTENTAALIYRGQPGALNESFSDVFGIMVNQYANKQTAEESDWLIGAGLFTRKIKGKALRSMKDPGTAYDDPLLGKDPQPSDMDHYVQTTRDNGGVHINSSIPNRAFCETAMAIGGNTWEKAGKIWYVTLTKKLESTSDFKECADATLEVANTLYGENSKETKAVYDGWKKVKVTPEIRKAKNVIRRITPAAIYGQG